MRAPSSSRWRTPEPSRPRSPAPAAPPPTSFTEIQARIVSALARLVERHAGAVLVAVSHADPIKAAVAQALGTPLDLFQRIAIAPASITAIAYRLEGPLVLTINSMDGDLAGLVA